MIALRAVRLFVQVVKIVKDESGRTHARFEQTYGGLEVVDTAIVMHIDADGTVYALKGELWLKGPSIPRSESAARTLMPTHSRSQNMPAHLK